MTWRYFDVYKIPILRGRGFTAGDDAGAQPVVVIDETMARQYWPDSSPIGERIRLDDGDPQSTEPYREIVGVVADVRELELVLMPENRPHVERKGLASHRGLPAPARFNPATQLKLDGQ